MEKTAAIILAAGQGSRMISDTAKVLHPLAGLEMIRHVVRSVRQAGFDEIVAVVGYQAERVGAVLEGIRLVEQKERLGTGHAVEQCRFSLRDFRGPVLVTYGDTPLFRGETFAEILKYHGQQRAAATVVTAIFEDPTGYGRILRKGNEVLGVVEHKDADAQQLLISEINTGTYCFQSDLLFQYLTQITPDNYQAEYYLPDVLPLMIAQGHKVAGYLLPDARESLGINDRMQLAQAEAIMRERICRQWLEKGVTIIDPAATFIELDCTIGQDTVIYPQSFIQKGTVIGRGCVIGPNCRLSAAQIGDDVFLEHSVIVGGRIAAGERLDPFTFLTT